MVIEQAKGMLAEYLGMSVDDAFRRLRSYARDHDRKLSDVARDVVERKISSTAFGEEGRPPRSGAAGPSTRISTGVSAT